MYSIKFILFCLLISSISSSSSLNSDGLSLLALKSAITTDPSSSLSTWSESDVTPCNWLGITCNPKNHRVTSISLPNKNLSGYLPSELGALLFLQHLSLSSNNFSNIIPVHLFNASNLLSLDLSHNFLSGPIPNQIISLKSLQRLDLSNNLFNGSLPESLNNLTHLVGTLNLSFNRFAGEVPASYGFFPVTVSLDLRYNNLTGKIPQVGSLLNQGPTAFTGNPGLCGFPLQTLCSEPEKENPTRSSSDPEKPLDPNMSNGFLVKQKAKSGLITVPLISGVSVLIGVVFVSMWVYRKRWRRTDTEGKIGKEEKVENGKEKEKEKDVSEEGEKGKFVVVDGGFGLELEDLLRASAYVVGKSRSGIVYKVVVGRGSGAAGAAGAVVAVRRLSEGDTTWRFKEFESEVEAIGKVQHPNVVKLRAYYYANDEKLLISEFISNGSLHTALHGGPANTLQLLSWAVRLKIAQGIARGLTHIHECSPRKYVHGNIKSSKILLDNDLQPHISGFGLSRLFSGSASKSTNSASKKLNANQIIITSKDSSSSSSSSSSSMTYVAPEARVSGNKFTSKCDVYSFGIVLLEILTGRSPEVGPDNDGKGLEGLVRKVFREERPLSEIIDPKLLQEVQSKKQVVAAFHIALNCTELDPELRPRMRTVSEGLDRIKLQ